MAIADAEFVIPAPAQTQDEPLKARVKRVLLARFPQATVEFYKASMPRLCGNVYWEGFEGIAMSERHRMVRTALEEHFTEDELENDITGFYTHTPFENTFIEQPEEGQTES